MKTLPSLTRPAVGVVCAVASLLFAGCASNSQSIPGSNGQIAVVEYDNVWVTGSNIPIRVPRSSTAHALPTISPMSILTQDDVRRMSNAPMH